MVGIGQGAEGQVGRHIPEAIKLLVRKKCGFGCVICGLPIYHYDHIEDFAVVNEHVAENIVLLCPGHHQEKTSKRLSKEVVERASESPANLNKEFSAPHPILMVGDTGRLEVGSNVYEFDFPNDGGRFEAIRILGETVFGLTCEDGNLLLDIILTDKNGEVILKVERGEMKISTGVWDYRIEGQSIQIRSAERSIDLVLILNDDGIKVERGLFIKPPIALVIEPTHHTIMPNRITMSGCFMENCAVGLVVE